jgi:hypothetical protein
LLIYAMDCRLYNWAMRWVVPRIRFTWHHAKLPDWKIRRGLTRLEAGDITLTYSRWQLTSMCIPGDLTHAALCVHGPFGSKFAEMVSTGWRSNDFIGVCEASRVVILRCTDWDVAYIQQVINKCESFEGTRYDRQFGLSSWLLSCAEMIWHSDVEKRANVELSDLLGLRKYITPNDYHVAAMDPRSNLQVIWDSDKEVQ